MSIPPCQRMHVLSMMAPYTIGAGSMANSDMNTTLNAIDSDLSSTATHLKEMT